MKIVNLSGGLGNQMFQYAFALSLKERYPAEEVYVDTSHYHTLLFKHYKGINLHNGFEIEKVFPNANLKQAKWHQLVRTTWYCPNYVLSRVVRKMLPQRKTEFIQKVSDYFEYCPQAYQIKGDCYYEGLWSSVRHFLPIKEKLKTAFAHPEATGQNAAYIEEMENTQSVGIHVRRGDYLSEPEFRDICEKEYYKRGVEEITRDGLRHRFYIFSNDMAWCKEYIAPLLKGHDVVFVTENTKEYSAWDMHLMRHCKDLIIANSSFSWWAAFLKENEGRVVAPKTWVNRKAAFDIWEKEWIRV